MTTTVDETKAALAKADAAHRAFYPKMEAARTDYRAGKISDAEYCKVFKEHEALLEAYNVAEFAYIDALDAAGDPEPEPVDDGQIALF